MESNVYCVYKTGVNGNKEHPWTVDATSRLEARKYFSRKTNSALSQISAMTAEAYDRWQEREQAKILNQSRIPHTIDENVFTCERCEQRHF